MISLGCAKNLVDAEIMLGSVLQHGMQVTADAEDADVLVVNTCAFIDAAKQESIDAILEAREVREVFRLDLCEFVRADLGHPRGLIKREITRHACLLKLLSQAFHRCLSSR
jgi:hypothetical protein